MKRSDSPVYAAIVLYALILFISMSLAVGCKPPGESGVVTAEYSEVVAEDVDSRGLASPVTVVEYKGGYTETVYSYSIVVEDTVNGVRCYAQRYNGGGMWCFKTQ